MFNGIRINPGAEGKTRSPTGRVLEVGNFISSYKTECKQLEEFLEEESSKKEDEIRKIKEEAIKK